MTWSILVPPRQPRTQRKVYTRQVCDQISRALFFVNAMGCGCHFRNYTVDGEIPSKQWSNINAVAEHIEHTLHRPSFTVSLSITDKLAILTVEL